MQNIFTALIFALLLTGCASAVNTTTSTVQAPEKHYTSIMTLVANIDADFSQLDSTTYEKYFKGKFNNLEQSRYRSQMENALFSALRENQVQVIGSSQVFKVNDSVGYSQFLKEVQKAGVDGILFVNRKYQGITLTKTNDTNDANLYTEQDGTRVVFHSYLINPQTLKPVWYANTTASYDMAESTLARQLQKKLKQQNYINTPLVQ
ncbi:hypothetical protein [Pontibacter vulgaris]|uniref:hypothetical protein n=1 Tax=Pontibacter vulgaris TaxID=2905679 RepID=UPI001FA81000|nr:hypothetical protein [Pontibacter vulgaris]